MHPYFHPLHRYILPLKGQGWFLKHPGVFYYQPLFLTFQLGVFRNKQMIARSRLQTAYFVEKFQFELPTTERPRLRTGTRSTILFEILTLPVLVRCIFCSIIIVSSSSKKRQENLHYFYMTPA